MLRERRGRVENIEPLPKCQKPSISANSFVWELNKMRYCRPRHISLILAHSFVLLICFFIYYTNKLPEGYLISGTDHTWFLNLGSSFWSLFYTWTNDVGYGAGTPYFLQASILFYAIQYITHLLYVSVDGAQSFMLFVFMYFSFWSFYASLHILKLTDENIFLKILFSLVYGINSYTLYLFMHVFGYFYQQLLYIFIPILFSLFFSAIVYGWNSRKVLLFFITSFFCSMGFNNPGFFVATCVVLAFSYALTSFAQINKVYTNQYVAFWGTFLILFIANSFWLIPYVDVALSVSTGLDNDLFDLKDWIRWQSTRIVDFFRFYPITSSDKFPYNSTYDESIISILVLFSFLPTVVFFYGLIIHKKNRKFEIVLLCIYLFLVFASIKARAPFGDLVVFLFTLPIINSLRSYDKFFIFVPFFLMLMIYINIFRNARISNRIKYIIVITFLIFPIPFYTGKLQQNISTAFRPGESFLTAQYSNLVKIPDEYYKIADIINQSSRNKSKIMYLPFDALISPGWSQYPKWRFRGNDITATLFDKPVLRPSVYLSDNKFNYGILFNDNENPDWIKRFMGFTNSEFLVFHKDVDTELWKSNYKKIHLLEKSHALSRIYSGEYVDLYRLNSIFNLPLIYVPNFIQLYTAADYQYFVHSMGNPMLGINSVFLEIGSGDLSKLSDRTLIDRSKKYFDSSYENSYEKKPHITSIRKINSTKYEINVIGAKEIFPLVFSESYHEKWRIMPFSFSLINEGENSLQVNNNSTLDYDIYRETSNNIEDNSPHARLLNLKNDVLSLWPEIKDTAYGFLGRGASNSSTMNFSNLHYKANGFANIWFVDSSSICKKVSCFENEDGSQNFNLIIEFLPQRLFYVGLYITFSALIVALVYIIYKLLVSCVSFTRYYLLKM